MEKIFFPNEIKVIENIMKEKYQLSDEDLISNAAEGFVKHFLDFFDVLKTDNILIVSGVGNNGKDGISISTILEKQGYKTDLFVINNEKKILNAQSIEDEKKFQAALEKSTFIIDGIFGIGLSRNVSGIYEKVIQSMNRFYEKIISIDIPSGLNAFNGLVMNHSIKAAHTFVIGAYKTGNYLSQAKDYCGQFHLIQTMIDYTLIENKKYIVSNLVTLPKREHFSHKYNYGNVLVVGGKRGYFGSIQLAAMASLRTGSGLARVAIQEKYIEEFPQIYPEIIVHTYQTINEFIFFSDKIDAFVFGPGIEDNNLNLEVFEYLMSTQKPVLIDASGLDFFNLDDEYLNQSVLLTPHSGEISRMLDISNKSLLQDPFESLLKFTNKGYTILLKGPTTMIASKDEIYLLPYGSPGMATAGMGDVLSGIILSLLGRKMDPLESIINGALLHMNSTIEVISKIGEDSLIASDILTELPNQILKGKSK